MKEWWVGLEEESFSVLISVVFTYMVQNEMQNSFPKESKFAEGFLSLQQSILLKDVLCLIQVVKVAGIQMFAQSAAFNHALDYLGNLLFGRWTFLTLDYDITCKGRSRNILATSREVKIIVLTFMMAYSLSLWG